MDKVIVILGQTATGKSNLAVKIAKKINGEIISADSRQVYKGLNIGTGKIKKEEMEGVPHHLIDVTTPKKTFTVAEFQKLAMRAMADIVARGKTPIIVGGTGFYIDSVTKGIVLPEVPPNKTLRAKLSTKSAEFLYKILVKLDEMRAKNIDPKNKLRLIRAIEIATALGVVPKIKRYAPIYKYIKIGLYLDRVVLNRRIEKRVKKMFKDGLLREINRLKRAGVSEKRLREFGFEYNSPTLEKVISKTLKYAKRQMTWFKRDKEIKWLNASKPVKITKIL